MQKIKHHQEKSWAHLFRMRALRLMKGSKQERRKTEKKRQTLQKAAGNSLFLSKPVADTDLSQSQHLLPTRRVSPRQAQCLWHRNTRSWLGTMDVNEKSFWKHQWAKREGNLFLWWKTFLFWPTGKLADFFFCRKASLPTWEMGKKAWFWTSDTYGSVC